jgi:hypothetical protein
VNSTAILYAANWLPKKYAYVIAVSSCVIFGILWLGFSSRTLKRLQELPIKKWYLPLETVTDNTTKSDGQGENDHGVSLIANKEMEQVLEKSLDT